jgi:hypothetical protein
MDNGNLETSFITLRIAMIGGHFAFGDIGLGEFTPFKLDKVTSLDSFIFGKSR